MENLSHFTEADVYRAINNVSVFAGIGIHEQHMLFNKLVVVHRKPEEIVIEQGDVGDTLYIIMKGKVIVSLKRNSSTWLQIKKLGPGDVFGEIAILRNIPRTARITTETACTFLAINAKDFLDIYQYFPPAARDNIQLVVKKRLDENRDRWGVA